MLDCGMDLTGKISRIALDHLVERYASDTKTLEVGAYGSPSYGRFFNNKIGIDVRPGPGVDQVASVYELPFESESFDVVLCLSVLEHLETPQKAIEEMKRVLKPGGRIIVSVPFLFPIHDAPGDYWRFTKFGLRNLFKHNWNIVELRAETTTQETFAVLFQRVGYQTQLRWNRFSKGIIFLVARILSKLPTLTVKVFGDIKKSTLEPEAFASAFFLVAEKLS